MTVKSIPLRLEMKGNTQVENITTRVQNALAGTGLKAGVVTVFIKHTTAAVLIIEDEPGIRADTVALWNRLIPADPGWQHNLRNAGEDNAHSHLRALARNVAAARRDGFRYPCSRTRSGRPDSGRLSREADRIPSPS